MKKKFKLESMYLISIGNVTGNYGNRLLQNIKGGYALAYAKYEIFTKGNIKYFVNILDGTKYYPQRKQELGLCAITQIPISIILKNDPALKKRYITYDEAIEILNKYTKELEDEDITSENGYDNSEDKKTTNTVKKLSCGNILNNKIGTICPTIGREKEIESLIISLAQQKKNPLLVGPPGVGKTAIADTLAYKIAKGEVPRFLKEREIVEISTEEIVSNTKYTGELEKKMLSLIKYLKQRNAILLINEIHKIYGAGTTEKTNIDVAGIILNAIDRENIKVIGTTTDDEYKEFFAPTALKRRFERIAVSEPENSLLYEIICYTFDNYSKSTGISIDNLDSNIINILINLTDIKHRKYDDKLYNPDLVIGVIDKAFAIALVNDSLSLENEYVIESIRHNERIYDSAKQEAIKMFKNTEIKQKNKKRVLELR